MHLERREIETFLPEMPVDPRAATCRPAPFFPGYLFVNIDIGCTAAANWLVPGATYLVGYGEEPAPIPDDVIRLIARHVDWLDAQRGRRGRFQPGDPVRITEGPFRDMLAIFDDDCEPRQRVHILLNAICGTLRLRLPVTSLEKVGLEQLLSLPRPPRRTRGRGRPIHSRS